MSARSARIALLTLMPTIWLISLGVSAEPPSTGLPGTISGYQAGEAQPWTPLVSNAATNDIDLTRMAGWALRHLTRNPRPALDYEPNFYIRPMEVPPAPEGHDAIVPGDTDVRMAWEYPYMREILGISRPGLVEQGLHRRVMKYLQEDGFAWVPPGHYMEGEVYSGAVVGPQKVVSTWATAKLLRSLSENFARTGNPEMRRKARHSFLALKRLAEWDTGRAYYAGGSGAWLDGKWVKTQFPTAAVEPLVAYWEATKDGEALSFAKAVAEGLLADEELLPKANARISRDGEFHGHMHSTLHGVWGVAHLGAMTSDARYIGWAKDAYDYAKQFSTGTGWISAALWDEPVRELSETCATSDMVSIAYWLARAGLPEYWDDIERTLRNYLFVQQFFITPQYEKMYRELNRTKPGEQIEAGLRRMRDFEGGFMGGPAPNDWINWIAGPKQCGPYNTPYGCMGMFGCCIPEGMRALHTVWEGALRSEKGVVFVNLSLNRKGQEANVVSSLPGQGRVDVTARKAGKYLLRPPSWAVRSKVQLYRGGHPAPLTWDGPGRAYVAANSVRIGETLTLLYPLARWTQSVAIWPTQPDLRLTITWRGNTVTGMEPKGKGLPIDFAHRRSTPPLPLDADSITAR